MTNFFLKSKAATPFNVSLQLLLPLWTFAFLSYFGLPNIDRFFASAFYVAGQQWIGTNSVICAVVIHQFGKYLPALIGVICFGVWIFGLKYRDKISDTTRKCCLYIVLCIIACTVAVSVGKYFSAKPCPWSLLEFGGNGQGGKCFPAGHVGAAFCLFSLYFVSLRIAPGKAWGVLLGVLYLGAVYGISRQMQGAHFLSHTLATLSLDWFICAFLYMLMLRGDRPIRFFVKQQSVNTVVATFSVYLVFFMNQPFLGEAAKFLGTADVHSALTLLSCGLILFCAFFAVLNVLPRQWVLPISGLLLVVTAAVVFVANHAWGVVINTEMMKNILATDLNETRDTLSLSLAAEALFLMLPGFLAWKALPERSRFGTRRLGYSLVAIVLAGVCTLVNYQSLSSLMRGDPIAKNLISPINVYSSGYRVLTKQPKAGETREREVIDAHPTLGATHAQERGVLMVVVVGETARKANWGLTDYERQTTPQLQTRGVINFPDVTACGTSTDVSLPCMFSRVGRADYDRKRILREESLLPLMRRAGADVYWVDNQSGCKGVCDGVESLPIQKDKLPMLCKGGECYDEALLAGIDVKKIVKPGKTTVVFLHQLGNHGASYYKRYPKRFAKYGPVCESNRLDKCSRDEITNAYDNALMYTDNFLAGVIDWLDGLRDLDTAMLYVSDHGESLGENNLYLHGSPEIIAPKEQKQVPMALWLSDGMKERIGLDNACMQKQAMKPTTHDQLYSSLLGILDIKSDTYRRENDFTAVCRNEQKALLAMEERQQDRIHHQSEVLLAAETDLFSPDRRID